MHFFMDAQCFKELEIKPTDLYKVIQKMVFKKMDAGETVFKYQDVGDFFYILIYGRVQLYLPNAEISAMQREVAMNQILLVQEFRQILPEKELKARIEAIKKHIASLEEQIRLMPELTPALEIKPV